MNFKLRVQDLVWTEMSVEVEAETEEEAISKIINQHEDVTWGKSEVIWDTSNQTTDIYSEDRSRVLWSRGPENPGGTFPNPIEELRKMMEDQKFYHNVVSFLEEAFLYNPLRGDHKDPILFYMDIASNAQLAVKELIEMGNRE